MEDLIYYMPSKDFNPSEYSQEECFDRLVKSFEEFLVNEKKFLMSTTS
jgi:hypothetical protein